MLADVCNMQVVHLFWDICCCVLSFKQISALRSCCVKVNMLQNVRACKM